MVKKIEILYLNQYSSIDFHDEKQETLKSAYNLLNNKKRVKALFFI